MIDSHSLKGCITAIEDLNGSYTSLAQLTDNQQEKQFFENLQNDIQTHLQQLYDKLEQTKQYEQTSKQSGRQAQ